MTVRVAVDLNVRLDGGQTYTGLEDCDGPVERGDQVVAYERESGIETGATVTSIAPVTGLVYLRMDWDGFREPEGAADDPACE